MPDHASLRARARSAVCGYGVGGGVATHRCAGLPSIVMPVWAPPAAGVSTTLCGPDGTFTLVPQLGHVSVYTIHTVPTLTRRQLGASGLRGYKCVVHSLVVPEDRMAQLARGLDWFRVVFALLGVLLVLVWFYLGVRSRRSLRLNQALRAEHALPHRRALR
jgi:hypothetical protein